MATVLSHLLGGGDTVQLTTTTRIVHPTLFISKDYTHFLLGNIGHFHFKSLFPETILIVLSSTSTQGKLLLLINVTIILDDNNNDTCLLSLLCARYHAISSSFSLGPPLEEYHWTYFMHEQTRSLNQGQNQE